MMLEEGVVQFNRRNSGIARYESDRAETETLCGERTLNSSSLRRITGWTGETMRVVSEAVESDE